MALNDNKAGMDGLDRDKINKIIMEASKVSSAVRSNLSPQLRVNHQEKSFLPFAEGFCIIVLVSIQGSKFYENELKREQQMNQRIEKMMLQKEQITEEQLKKGQVLVRRVKSMGWYKTKIPLKFMCIF